MTIIASFHLVVLEDCFKKIIIMMKTLQNDQINKENFAGKYNNNDKNKNTGRPEVVINQYLENETVYPRRSVVYGTNSYSEALAHSQTNSHTIKVFSDSKLKVYKLNK